jgi:hypothetical protein
MLDAAVFGRKMGLIRARMYLSRRGVRESMWLYRWVRKHKLTGGVHKSLIKLLRRYGQRLAEAAVGGRGVLRGPEACKRTVRRVAEALGSKGPTKGSKEVGGTTYHFTATDAPFLMSATLCDPKFKGCIDVPRASNSSIPSRCASSPCDSEVCRQAYARLMSEWDETLPNGDFKNCLHHALHVRYGAKYHISLFPLFFSLFVDGVACSTGLHVDLINYQLKLLNLTPQVARTVAAFLPAGVAMKIPGGKAGGGLSKEEAEKAVNDAYSAFLLAIGFKPFFTQGQPPMIVLGEDSNGVLPDFIEGKPTLFVLNPNLANLPADAAEVHQQTGTKGCMRAQCLNRKSLGADVLGDFEESGAAVQNYDELMEDYKELNALRVKFQGQLGRKPGLTAAKEKLTNAGFTAASSGPSISFIPPQERHNFAFFNDLPVLNGNPLTAYPPDILLHVLLTGLAKYGWLWFREALLRSRGYTGAGKDALGGLVLDAANGRLRFVPGFAGNGFRPYRQVPSLDSKKTTFAPGRVRWSMLFAMVSIVSPALLPNTTFRRQVLKCLELLLAILSFCHMHVHTRSSLDILGELCKQYRDTVKATFGGKKYQGGEKSAAEKADMDDGEFSFPKFHALTELLFWVSLWGIPHNFSLHVFEYIQGQLKAAHNLSNGSDNAAQCANVLELDAIADRCLPSLLEEDVEPLDQPLESSIELKETVSKAVEVATDTLPLFAPAWEVGQAACDAFGECPSKVWVYERANATRVEALYEPPGMEEEVVEGEEEEEEDGSNGVEVYAKGAPVTANSLSLFYPSAKGNLSVDFAGEPMFEYLLDPKAVNDAEMGLVRKLFKSGGQDFVVYEPLAPYKESDRGEDTTYFKPRVLSGKWKIVPLQYLFCNLYGLPWWDEALPAKPIVRSGAAPLYNVPEEEKVKWAVEASVHPQKGVFLVSTFIRS